MSFLQLARARQSVRHFTARPVEREKIERCLEAVRLAPSACNSQPWRFIVVDDPGPRDTVARATFGAAVSFNRFTVEAPALVVAVREPAGPGARLGGFVKRIDYGLIDLGIAAEHFCLQAVEEGLGTCILGWFAAGRIKRILGIPGTRKIALMIALGYPATAETREKQRKRMDEIRAYNRY